MKILVVEDDPLILTSLREMVEAWGCACDTNRAKVVGLDQGAVDYMVKPCRLPGGQRCPDRDHRFQRQPQRPGDSLSSAQATSAAEHPSGQ
jgi:hypothetical protein